MIIEHTFVTTFEGDAALDVAARLLASFYFEITARDESILQARRGASNAGRAKNACELPQRVRIEFDRGRITLAASIEPGRKPKPEHAALMKLLATTMEAYLCRPAEQDAARAAWWQLEQKIVSDARRRRLILKIVLALLLLATFVFIVVAATLAR